MMTKNKKQKANGAALILVVVVTVLLAVIGVMFLMVSRLSEMETVAVADGHDLDAAVKTVVGRIDSVLVVDLFGNDDAIVNADLTNPAADEPYDFPEHNNIDAGADGIIGTVDDAYVNPGAIWLTGLNDDGWLASLEPVFNDNGTPANLADDYYEWPHVTDLWGTLNQNTDSLYFQRFTEADDSTHFVGRTSSYFWTDDGSTLVSAYHVETRIIASDDPVGVYELNDSDLTMPFGARADADGDGVSDSRWVKVPGLMTSRGKDVFAAVRIIDNCAMLNLNAAHCFYQEPYDTLSPVFKDALNNPVSPFEKPWFYNDSDYGDFVTNYNASNFDTAEESLYHRNDGSGSGRYLTEINYLPFLRGSDLNGDFFGAGASSDDWMNLMEARGLFERDSSDAMIDFSFTPQMSAGVFMNLESPGDSYHFFDIADELELRNRYLVTSHVEARFEQDTVANFSLDAGGGTYGSLETPVDDNAAFNSWKIKVDPSNFDNWSGFLTVTGGAYPYRYDRRHVCTFYSYDRNLRQGDYPLLDSEIGLYATANLAGSGYATVAAYKAYLWNLWGPIFTPKGAVTTNIENPDAAQPYNNVETRKRIVHLLYALREYYLPVNYFSLPAAQQVTEKNTAALKAAQVVANLIDFSDDNALNPTTANRQGPFYDGSTSPFDYGAQANADCTFITRNITRRLMTEVSLSILGTGNAINWNLSTYNMLEFGLGPTTAVPATDRVFGYERQPFISEVAADWNGSPVSGNPYLEAFGLELVNPYSDMIDIKDWQIKIGSNPGKVLKTFNSSQGDVQWQVPGATDPNALGYAVLHRAQQALGSINYAPGGVLITDPVTDFDSIYTWWSGGQSLEIQLLRPAPANSGVSYIVVDRISNSHVRSVLGTDGVYSLQRDDDDWKFVYEKYASVITIATLPYILGTENSALITDTGFQLGVPDDQYPLARWHDLEVLSLFGNDDAGAATPLAITNKISTAAAADLHYDLAGASEDLLDYLCTINRPNVGTLPGRININTAAVPVIAAAIPPKLADDNVGTAVPVTFSVLQLAQAVVDYRQNNGPYETLSDLLNTWVDLNTNGVQDPDEKVFQRYYTNGLSQTVNTGQQSIEDDIEERDWILSNLANKFTVRSDVFTAYILVRLGEDGPQRRMIAIFDRSNVWNNTDRPTLVALHPVPDPR